MESATLKLNELPTAECAPNRDVLRQERLQCGLQQLLRQREKLIVSKIENLLESNLPETNGAGTPAFDVELLVSEVKAANVTLPSNVDLPADLRQYVVNVWASGGQTNYALAFQEGTNFQSMLDALVADDWQIDLCRIIEPASLGTLSREYPTPASAVPRATVDLGAYEQYFEGELEDYEYPAERIEAALRAIPAVAAP